MWPVACLSTEFKQSKSQQGSPRLYSCLSNSGPRSGNIQPAVPAPAWAEAEHLKPRASVCMQQPLEVQRPAVRDTGRSLDSRGSSPVSTLADGATFATFHRSIRMPRMIRRNSEQLKLAADCVRVAGRPPVSAPTDPPHQPCICITQRCDTSPHKLPCHAAESVRAATQLCNTC